MVIKINRVRIGGRVLRIARLKTQKKGASYLLIDLDCGGLDINIYVFGDNVDFLEPKLDEDDQIVVDGRLSKNGIVANKVILL